MMRHRLSNKREANGPALRGQDAITSKSFSKAI